MIQNCKLNINNRTTFFNNSAQTQGGAVNNDILEAVYSDDVRFAKNNAKIYGDNIAAFAQLMGMISKEKYQSTIKKYYLNDNGVDPYYTNTKKGMLRNL